MSEHEKKVNSFKESIDKIEPSDGAKERMLQNIQRKANEGSGAAAEKEAKTSKILPFQKIIKWALPIAACFAFIMVGIGVIPNLDFFANEGDSGVQVTNPFIEVQSAGDFKDKLDISIDAPEGSCSVKFYILDKKIAHIDFEYGGNNYTLRASKQSGDFSGIQGNVIKHDKIDAENDAVLETINDTELTYFKMTWTDGEVTYILFNNSVTSANDITEVYKLLK